MIFDRGHRPTLRPGERSEAVAVLLPCSEAADLRREAASRGIALSALLRERLATAARAEAALRRIVEIEAECPTWWDDPIAGVGAVARQALDARGLR